jgi:cytochrome b6-f complex iron-sulfur subunit
MKQQNNNIPRRDFLSRIITAWFSVILLPIFYILFQYLVPPRLKELLLEKLVAGKITDFPEETAKVVKFNKLPVIVLNAEGKFKAFNARCTHLGCIVEYRPDEKHFVCNCHNSRFDNTGKNVSGPAPTPLEPLKVDVKNNDVIISQI